MLHLRTPLAGGVCTALVSLEIRDAHMDGDELENMVSSLCPRLKVLNLVWITLHGTHPRLTIRSGTLEMLWINIISDQPG